MTGLDELAPHFERLRMLPAVERAAELARLPLAADALKRLSDMLAADAQDDDLLAQTIAASAAGLHTPPAQQLGAYRLLRELGAGGMGTVFLAERADGQFTRQVAVKLLRGFPTREASRRLRLERQILAGLDHPHIAGLLDGGETADGQPWLALEYVDGLPLLEYIAQRAPTLRDRLALFEAMLDAVAFAHRHLVVHRDLKPGNVLVTQDGTVKLLDFGIARLIEAGENSAPSQTSTRIFSRGYASPEQQEGRAITTASDIYSLGVLLREMLTGRRDRAVAAAVVTPLPLDVDLAGIIAKATAAEPAQRYASAGEFADDLQRRREGRPVRATRWTRRYRIGKFIARHRLEVAVVLLGMVALAGFIWRIAHERNRALVAEAAAQQAKVAAQRDAASARASLDFLSAAFEAAAPENALSQQVSVRALLDTARAKLASNPDRAVVQTMQRMLAQLYGELGETAIALDLMRAGLQDVAPLDANDALHLADAYDGFSNLLGMSGDVAAALEAAHAAQRLRERYAPNDPVERVRSLIALASAQHQGGSDVDAVKRLREAMALADTTPTIPLALYADMSHTLSMLLATGGDAEAALAVADRALQRIDAQRKGASPERVKLLHSKAVAVNAAGDPATAEKLLREAIAMQDEVVASGGSRMMVMTNDLALILNDLGRYREAVALLRQSDVDMASAGTDNATDRALSHANYGGVLESAGDYPRALAEFDQAIRILDAAGIEADHQVRRRILRSQARTLGIVGEHARALAMFTDLRQRCARIEGEDSLEYAMLTWQLAQLAMRMQQPDTGLPLLEEATRRWHALAPDAHPIFLHAKRLRAAFALERGDVAAAARDQRDAVAGFEAQGALPVDLAIARSELAQVRWRQQRADDARKLLQQALPELRNSVLPTEVYRAAAEKLAKRAGLASPAS